ncbi:hypothetical protein ACIP4W_39725 [Streptomyces sp. NPDC088846]
MTGDPSLTIQMPADLRTGVLRALHALADVGRLHSASDVTQPENVPMVHG